VWFVKHNARIRPVKYNLVRRKHDDDPICPCCGALETTDHTFICDNAKMEEAFITNIADHESHLRATTSKAISDSILETCKSIRYNREHRLDDDWDEELASIDEITFKVHDGSTTFAAPPNVTGIADNTTSHESTWQTPVEQLLEPSHVSVMDLNNTVSTSTDKSFFIQYTPAGTMRT